MDPTALYYALSTIAQCAAALAALIGFLGIWRLERLRDEVHEVEENLAAGRAGGASRRYGARPRLVL
jgi:hypothetical protein